MRLLFGGGPAWIDPCGRPAAIAVPPSVHAPFSHRKPTIPTAILGNPGDTSRTVGRTVDGSLLESGPVLLETPHEQEHAERQGDDHQTLQESLHRFHLADSIPQNRGLV